jgi:hypothetical protein
MICLLSDV